MAEKKNTKKIILAVALLVVVIALMIGAYIKFSPKVNAGNKSIAVEVVHGDGTTNDFNYKTDAEYLRDVLEPEGLISGSETEYGMWLETVDGETADAANDEWWCITKGGGTVNYGVDDQPIADGEHYELTLKTGW